MGFFSKLLGKAVWSTILPGKGDWKTKLGSILAGIGGIITALPPLFPGQEAVSQVLISIGVALGGIGVADKMKKLTENITK